MVDTRRQISKPLQGIIFDFDGVIFDSEKHWAQVENPYLRRHIPDWKDEDYDMLVGKSLTEVHEVLVGRGLGVGVEQYFADYEVMAQELYAHLAKPIAPVMAVLSWARSHNVPCAIASSSKASWINLALRSHNLECAFELIVSAHDPQVAQGKPAPDVYLRAVKLLGVSARHVIAIEDSLNGALAAKAAGLFCIGFRNGENDTQDLTATDLIVHDFTNLLTELE